MHQGHDHDHQSGGSQGALHHHAEHGGVGHNHASHSRAAVQWQTPHRSGDTISDTGERDLDKVETAFIQGFMDAPDPTSFLRLARVPFEIAAADGTKLNLLRVEIDAVTDVGSITPHVGGASFRYDPLPASLVSGRRRLRFVYFDGANLRPLIFSEVRAV